MQYHASSKQFTVSLDDIQMCAGNMRFAIKMIRLSAGLPLEGAPQSGGFMSEACHAETAILAACKTIGIDLGATRAGELDVRDAG